MSVSRTITPEMMKQHVKNTIKGAAMHWTRLNLLHSPTVKQLTDWMREVADEMEGGDLDWDKPLP